MRANAKARRKSAPIAAALMLALSAAIARADASRYTITDLGSLPGASNTTVTGLNNLGQVIGSSGGVPYIYSDGKMSQIATGGTGINDGGQFATTANNFNARAISNSGEVAGSTISTRINGEVAATQVGGTVTPIPGISTESRADGINDSRQVVGEMQVFSTTSSAAVFHPFLISGGGVLDLGTLPGETSAAAYSVNNSGQVVGGGSSFTSTPSHAFLFSGGKMMDLGTLPGGTTSTATHINDSGQIIGLSDTASSGVHAFLYQNGTMTDLSDLVQSLGGVTITDLVGLNNRGQIAFDAEVNGEHHAYLMTPNAVPEPTALALGVAALLGWAARRRLGSLRVAGRRD